MFPLGERLTSVLSLPLHGGGQAASWQHVVVAGFSSGAVRVFADTGRLLVQVLWIQIDELYQSTDSIVK